MYGIAAYAQNLGIVLLEPAVSLPEEGGLAGSTRCEIKDVEGKHHRLFAAILTESNFSVLRRGELEIWGYVANFCRHNHTPLDYGGQVGRQPGDYNPQLKAKLSSGNFNRRAVLASWAQTPCAR